MPISETVSAMLAACRSQPEDNTARLVLADSVEESGHERAAQFIRNDVRKVAMPQRSGIGFQYAKWIESFISSQVIVRGNTNWKDLHVWVPDANHRRASLEIRRGLPEYTFVTAPLFLELPNLFLFPLVRVKFRDRSPERDFDYHSHPNPWCWHPAPWPQKFASWETTPFHLPPCLFDRLEGYDKTAQSLAKRYATQGAAVRALEFAALDYGRSLFPAPEPVSSS